MNAFVFTAPIVAGIWLLGMSARINAYTFLAMLGWKLIPLLLGLGSIFAGLKLWGVL